MKPQKAWWDTSEKKPRMHSPKFLQKQAEKATNVYLGHDKFDLINIPYFMELPADWQRHKHLNVPRGKNKHSALESSLIRLARQIVPLLRTPEPKKKQKTLVEGHAGYFYVDKQEKKADIVQEGEDDMLE